MASTPAISANTPSRAPVRVRREPVPLHGGCDLLITRAYGPLTCIRSRAVSSLTAATCIRHAPDSPLHTSASERQLRAFNHAVPALSCAGAEMVRQGCVVQGKLNARERPVALAANLRPTARSALQKRRQIQLPWVPHLSPGGLVRSFASPQLGPYQLAECG